MEKNNLSYEARLAALNALIEALENGTVPLDEFVSRFEEASRMLRECRAHLGALEKKIEILVSEKPVTFAPYEGLEDGDAGTVRKRARRSPVKAAETEAPADAPESDVLSADKTDALF